MAGDCKGSEVIPESKAKTHASLSFERGWPAPFGVENSTPYAQWNSRVQPHNLEV
jgi:hypothetical protein